MRLGVDLTWLGNKPAGVGTMVGDVLEELERREDIELVLFRAGTGPLKHWRLYKQINEANLDVLWQIGDWLPLLLPKGLKTIQTVHDLISFAHPEWFPQSGFSRWWSQKIRVARAIHRADVLHGISQWTASELKCLFPGSDEKIRVAYQPVRMPETIDLSKIPYEIKRPFLLVLGTIEPRKNIEGICDAFEQFATEYPEPHLVFVGGEGWKAEDSLQAIDQIAQQFPGRVHKLGYVDDATKWALLKEAGGLVMLSHAEGFGRPVVEAMLVGTPAIVAANSALKEVAEDAAVLVHPENTKKVARAMWRVLYHEQLPGRVIRLGHERARQLNKADMIKTILG